MVRAVTSQPERADSNSVVLRSGSSIPILGFGTWQMVGPLAHDAVTDALAVGYRHLDTATMYRNEQQIGNAIAESGLARDELFITTKVPGNAVDVRGTIEQSLVNLQVECVDLWLLHWPPAQSYESTSNSSQGMYEEMLAARDAGLARAVGVSNYTIEEIDRLIAATGEAPEVNQIPWSPFLYDPSIREEMERRGICLEGYSPLKTSQLDHPVVREIAASHGATAAQVVLRWHAQHGIVVIPKSAHLDRIRENFASLDVALSATAMGRLDDLASR
jgi:diketogulonate reductase-like aldo/keto reductase